MHFRSRSAAPPGPPWNATAGPPFVAPRPHGSSVLLRAFPYVIPCGGQKPYNLDIDRFGLLRKVELLESLGVALVPL